jgi:hydrogenase-4 component F
MVFLLLLLPPLAAAALAFLVRPFTRLVAWAGAALSVVSLAAALALALGATSGGEPLVFGPGDFLRADALSALAALAVAFAAALVLALGPGLARRDDLGHAQLRRYHIFANLFVFTMLFAVTANNVGFMWVAIEATTITSAVLIPLRVSKGSVEASWKYILIGSVGIAIAFLGTVVAYFNFATLVGHAEDALNWPVLVASAPRLQPEVLRFAFALLLVGYGTKAGLAPMHTWKPDAYGEAPPALSALMSSALFAVAIYAIARWKIVVDASARDGFSDTLLVALGLLSLGIAALSVVMQRNYKRMLAYSSVEHAGLVCIGLGLGPLGAFAAMLHLLNHTAAKSSMFLLAGRIERGYGSPLIADTGGLLRAMPITGGLFAAGLFALLGAPPFGIFFSELALFRAGFATGRYGVMAATLLLLAVAFIAFLTHANRMLYGEPPAAAAGAQDVGGWRLVPFVLALAVLVTLGAAVPGPVTSLLDRTVEVLTR